jgi:hypothetical protein
VQFSAISLRFIELFTQKPNVFTGFLEMETNPSGQIVPTRETVSANGDYVLKGCQV